MAKEEKPEQLFQFHCCQKPITSETTTKQQKHETEQEGQEKGVRRKQRDV